jgi:hypothetical protein
VGEDYRLCVFRIRSRRLFRYGIRINACLGYETKEIRHLMDCRKYIVSVQVPSLIIGAESSFSALQGPIPYIKHLVSPPRIPFTATYFGSLALTLYFSIGVGFVISSTDGQLHSTILTLLSAIVQILALLTFFASYVPGGVQGLRFGGRIMFNRAVSTLNS